MQNKAIPVRPETAVKNRYAAAAKAPEAALCCPVEYNRDLLKIIPRAKAIRPQQNHPSAATVVVVAKTSPTLSFTATGINQPLQTLCPDPSTMATFSMSVLR